MRRKILRFAGEVIFAAVTGAIFVTAVSWIAGFELPIRF